MPKSTVKNGLFTRLVRYAAAAVLLLAIPASQSGAADYPQRNVRFIIPFSAGGGADVLLRILANALADHWGHPTTVENRVGGNTVVGTVAAIGSPNDGYTLLFAGDQSITINPAMMTNLPYAVQKDLVPITLVAKNPMLLVVTNSTPAKNLKEFIALAKAKPEGITFGSSGAGSIQRLIMELTAQSAGVKLLHVPYKGSNEAVTAMLGGEIQSIYNGVSNFVELVGAGKLRAIAVATDVRSSQMPNVPTVKEATDGQITNLDNLPFRWLRRAEDGFREVRIDERDGAFVLSMGLGAVEPGTHMIRFSVDGSPVTTFSRAFERSHPLYVFVSNDWDTPDNADATLRRQETLRASHPELKIGRAHV